MNIGDLVGSVLQSMGDAVPGLQQAIEYDRMKKMDEEEKKRYQEKFGFEQRAESRDIERIAQDTEMRDFQRMNLVTEMSLSAAQSLAMDGSDDGDVEKTIDSLAKKAGIKDIEFIGGLILRAKALHKGTIKDVKAKDFDRLNARYQTFLNSKTIPTEKDVNNFIEAGFPDPTEKIKQDKADTELDRSLKQAQIGEIGSRAKLYSSQGEGVLQNILPPEQRKRVQEINLQLKEFELEYQKLKNWELLGNVLTPEQSAQKKFLEEQMLEAQINQLNVMTKVQEGNIVSPDVQSMNRNLDMVFKALTVQNQALVNKKLEQGILTPEELQQYKNNQEALTQIAIERGNNENETIRQDIEPSPYTANKWKTKSLADSLGVESARSGINYQNAAARNTDMQTRMTERDSSLPPAFMMPYMSEPDLITQPDGRIEKIGEMLPVEMLDVLSRTMPALRPVYEKKKVIEDEIKRKEELNRTKSFGGLIGFDPMKDIITDQIEPERENWNMNPINNLQNILDMLR